MYKLIHTEFKIQEIFPSKLANPINKQVLFANLSGNSPYILNLGRISL